MLGLIITFTVGLIIAVGVLALYWIALMIMSD